MFWELSSFFIRILTSQPKVFIQKKYIVFYRYIFLIKYKNAQKNDIAFNTAMPFLHICNYLKSIFLITPLGSAISIRTSHTIIPRATTDKPKYASFNISCAAGEK